MLPDSGYSANGRIGRGVRISYPAGFGVEPSLERRLFRIGDRLQLADWVRSPVAASEKSSSLNQGLAD